LARTIHDSFIEELAAKCYRALASRVSLVERLNDALAIINLFGAGCERLVHFLDLRGVNQGHS
jgi:hypothetical protein